MGTYGRLPGNWLLVPFPNSSLNSALQKTEQSTLKKKNQIFLNGGVNNPHSSQKIFGKRPPGTQDMMMKKDLDSM